MVNINNVLASNLLWIYGFHKLTSQNIAASLNFF